MSQTRTSRRPLLAAAGLAAALSLGLTACAQGADEPTETPTPASTPASDTASPSASESSPAAPAPETTEGTASPEASEPSEASESPTSAAPSAPASEPASSPAESSPAAAAQEATVFWVAEAGSGQEGVEFPGCGDLLVESTVSVPDSGEVGSTERVEAGINALLRNHEREDAGGLVNALYQSELELEEVSIAGDTVTVELSGQPVSAGTCDDPRIIAQLENTALTNAGVYTAEVTIDGTPIQEFMSQQG